MRMDKRRRLERAGWRVGTVQEFLGLTDEESAFIELKLLLAEHLRQLRLRRRWSQVRLSRFLGSSQSRVARMEGGDRSVTLDLLVKALLKVGATRQGLARLIAAPTHRSAA